MGGRARRRDQLVMTGRLAGRVAVITGAASGIGAATARRFVAEGARVIVADVQVDRGHALAGELGDAARFVRTDVTQEGDVAAAVDAAVSQFGRLDVVFNNAGIMGALGPIASIPVEDYSFTMAVNVLGVFLGMKHGARVMREQRSGVILSTTSPAAVAGGLGPHVYSAAKAAVIGLTQSVAAELRPSGIRVNAIMPGATVTAMTADILAGDADALAQAHEALARTALTTRPGVPDDVAAAAVYLASDDAGFVTGEVLRVDGGLTTAPGPSPFAQPEHAGAALMREAGGRGRGSE
jgi:NAD(P)-dependent dehydrogenase (short-subunit alcohol dehydrogenase family)